MSYIPYFALKIFAGLIHAIFARIFPKYSKHGRRLMTIRQKMTLIALSHALGIPYRDIPLLALDLADVLRIKNITSFQNFNAFAKKIRPQTLQTIIEAVAVITLKLDDDNSRVVLIDSTGFQIMDASSYYLWRAQRSADFFKLHVVMDLRTGAILLATPSDRYYHDIKPLRKYFLRELKRLCRRFSFRIKAISADSAYDSEDIYRRIRIELDAIPAIKPAKRRGLPRSGLRAKIWRIRHLPWFKHYVNMRWILEARFKTFKRLLGRVVRGKSEESRSREVLYKALLWNILVLLARLSNGGKRSLNKDEKIII